MPALHQWDYLFAFGTIFAALDAYNIGANDVANSFATSVSSKSLTMLQACMVAALMEFLGGVLVGARVSGTIKNSIVPIDAFQNNAGVQLLGFTVALCCSATWLMIATRNSWPVSTTYSIVSAVAGVGVAVGGKDAVQWGWNNGSGLAAIFAGFVVAPGISAGFAAIIYMLTKYCVLLRKNSLRAGFFTVPIFFFGVTAILTMCIIWKGSPTLKLKELPDNITAAAIVGTSAVVTVLSLLFWLPFVYVKTVRNDYTVRFYHFFLGPLLWWRKPPTDALVTDISAVPDYHVIHEGDTRPSNITKEERFASEDTSTDEKEEILAGVPPAIEPSIPLASVEDPHPIEGAWYLPTNIYIFFRFKFVATLYKLLTHGITIDIHKLQTEGTDQRRLRAMHERAKQYDNKTEHLYSFLQVMTACTASFAHGANDLGNAVGPYSAIYAIWSSGVAAGKQSETPVWILVAGALFLVLGLATYGYNIMAVLGNRMTLHSPSRGYSMELGSAITVVFASQYAIPVSTTMCITGATLGVALCNNDLKSFNWRGLGWIVLGWVLTVPIAGVSAGCVMGIILNAPHF
ncbi:sodium:inorganic phosphate symporter [Desarmillaria tabescens]|uniref:Phosphate transporter n=1 Tax=Armillaria tabescens TaxID=1929756 RepID=A0AA39NNP7_ARMTA|nr:sodium:inorganic phosphate symporter [Desarmillaria tabescens]KAK0469022.1 sodium:inorganic phosphate symporter [Desarmillaria tabescens]